MDTPDPGAPASAPMPVQVSLSMGSGAPKGPPVRFHSIIDALPSIALAGGFWMLIFHAVPAPNHELVSNVVAGLLGFVTRGAITRAGGPGQGPAQ